MTTDEGVFLSVAGIVLCRLVIERAEQGEDKKTEKTWRNHMDELRRGVKLLRRQYRRKDIVR